MSKDLVSTNIEKAGSALERARAAIKAAGESAAARKDFEVARTAAKNIKVAMVIDATASREQSWNAAMKAQTDIVNRLGTMAENVEIGLYYHSASKAKKIGWFNDGGQANHKMAQIDCETGYTKIEDSFDNVEKDTRGKRPDIAVLIGDCFEDDIESTIAAAKKIGAPVFAFHEKTAQSGPRDRDAFDAISKATGGACVSLGSKPEDIATYVETAVAIKRGGADLKAVTNSEAYRKLVAANPEILRLSHGK